MYIYVASTAPLYEGLVLRTESRVSRCAQTLSLTRVHLDAAEMGF